ARREVAASSFCLHDRPRVRRSGPGAARGRTIALESLDRHFRRCVFHWTRHAYTHRHQRPHGRRQRSIGILVAVRCTLRQQAESELVGTPQENDPVFGKLESLRRLRVGALGATLGSSVASRFTVEYKDGHKSLLVLIKPTLLGDEPEDVANYAIEHPLFPQEP